MKLEEAQSAIAKVVQWKTLGRTRELAFLRRGPKPENLFNCMAVTTQFVYPASQEYLAACAEVLSAFVSADCVNGKLGLGTGMRLLVDSNPSASERVYRVLAAQNIVELASALRPVLTLLRKADIQIDYARLLAHVANFTAWADSVRSRWSLGFYRGLRSENEDCEINESKTEEQA